MKEEKLNKFIKEQLKKVNIAMHPYDWDDSTTTIIIQKQGTNNKSTRTDFIIGMSYDIIIADYIINPPPEFSLASNWNFGTTPPEVNLCATVLQIMGSMIKFKCVGKTTNVIWEGWLPRNSIKKIEVSACL